MDIDPPQPTSVESSILYEGESLIVFSKRDDGECHQQLKNHIPICQVAARQFSNDEWVAEHAALVQQSSQSRVATPEVVYPDGRIDENHY